MLGIYVSEGKKTPPTNQKTNKKPDVKPVGVPVSEFSDKLN